ncbi:helix-turn-helix domain-containing protein [Bradyrhizobium niftali]|uniref:helix-turn-helix domain-containing protein n=1 Tax=Bradyrhizobium niftali TaxID=2560055 RepID=UPI0014317F26|nr:helix-turn-helix domain-containing protein [Bradyrhizobium niftali]
MKRHDPEQGAGYIWHRSSVRVSKAAELLEVDICTIYRAIRSGDIEAHFVGKRGIRVFADSLRNYQERNLVAPRSRSKSSRQRPRSRPHSVQYQEAEAFLRDQGVL